MTGPAPAWPVKRREMQNHHMDSTAWNRFRFRDDDIVIATYAKSGTTWMQQILTQLIFNGAEDVEAPKLSPWVDLRTLPPEAIAALEAQTHRRFVKTHLPVDALVFSPRAKYLYIGRDGRDTAWSFYNHLANCTDAWFALTNGAPGRVGPPIEPVSQPVDEFYRTWMERDGFPYWPFWHHLRSWWAIRDLPNVRLLHFNDLKADLPGAIREIAAYLGIAIDEAVFPAIVAHCSFDYMKAHADQVAPRGGAAWKGGGKTFINQGTNGRWRDLLTPADIDAYEKRAVAELGAECAAWLEHGRNGMNGGA